MKKVIWSLFDGSGIMVKPWADAGHKCYCFNSSKANHGEYVVRMEHENIKYVDVWIDDGFPFFIGKAGIEFPDIIFSFPDCTASAGSGAKHERDEDDIKALLSSCELVEHLAETFNCPWFVENPVGKLCTRWRKPEFYFDPYQFGGYMTDEDKPYHPKMPMFDGYTKKTGIWCGNGFVRPEKKNGPINIGCFWGWKWLGGKSTKTKQLRSLTPRGFAAAVYEANK
jgi:hypothetical protein